MVQLAIVFMTAYTKRQTKRGNTRKMHKNYTIHRYSPTCTKNVGTLRHIHTAFLFLFKKYKKYLKMD